MILLLLLIAVLVALVVIFRKEIYIAIQKNRIRLALKKADEYVAAHEKDLADKALALKTRLEADVQRAENEGWPFTK